MPANSEAHSATRDAAPSSDEAPGSHESNADDTTASHCTGDHEGAPSRPDCSRHLPSTQRVGHRHCTGKHSPRRAAPPSPMLRDPARRTPVRTPRRGPRPAAHGGRPGPRQRAPPGRAPCAPPRHGSASSQDHQRRRLHTSPSPHMRFEASRPPSSCAAMCRNGSRHTRHDGIVEPTRIAQQQNKNGRRPASRRTTTTPGMRQRRPKPALPMEHSTGGWSAP